MKKALYFCMLYSPLKSTASDKFKEVRETIGEHRANALLRLVLETLTPLPSDRKCFRMINGVLAERTVGEVLPALQTNADGLKKVLEDLVKQYRSKQDEMEKWKVS